MDKLEMQHKHILKLISRDSDSLGWAEVSEKLFDVLSKNTPSELATFEKTDNGCRARLTQEGRSVVEAMRWL